MTIVIFSLFLLAFLESKVLCFLPTHLKYQLFRGIAQPGSALRSGRRGREFKSRYPDRRLEKPGSRQANLGFFFNCHMEHSMNFSHTLL